jgi:hypothetical protein
MSIQICWSNPEDRSPSFNEILPSLISWLDEWLDGNAYAGQAHIRFEKDGTAFERSHGVEHSHTDGIDLRFGID